MIMIITIIIIIIITTTISILWLRLIVALLFLFLLILSLSLVFNLVVTSRVKQLNHYESITVICTYMNIYIYTYYRISYYRISDTSMKFNLVFCSSPSPTLPIFLWRFHSFAGSLVKFSASDRHGFGLCCLQTSRNFPVRVPKELLSMNSFLR